MKKLILSAMFILAMLSSAAVAEYPEGQCFEDANGVYRCY